MEALLAELVELPFWVSVVVAAFFFVLMWFVLPLFGATSPAANVLAQVSSTTAPWAAGLLLLAGLAGEVRRRWRRFVASRIDGLDAIRRLDWPAFEAYVAEVYRHQGYSVTKRGGPQADGGVDLEMRRGGQRLLVQCKQWGYRQVPVQRVRELLGVVTSEGADGGVLVATAGFTRDARAFAASQSIELVDGGGLVRLAKAGAQPTTAGPPPSAEPSPDPPVCPNCSRQMVKRTARRGRAAGSTFWGCPAYPDCRGTRAA